MVPLPSWSSGGEEPLLGAGGRALAPALSLTEPPAEVVAQVKLELATLAERVLERLPMPSTVSADDPASGAGQSVDKTLWVQCEAAGCGVSSPARTAQSPMPAPQPTPKSLPIPKPQPTPKTAPPHGGRTVARTWPQAAQNDTDRDLALRLHKQMNELPKRISCRRADLDGYNGSGLSEEYYNNWSDTSNTEEQEGDDEYKDEETKPAKDVVKSAMPKPKSQPTPSTPSRLLPSSARRRIEYCFEVGSEFQWFSGTVQRDDAGDWVQVVFDDGDYLSVKVSPSMEGKVWRWLDEPGHRRERSNQPAGAAANTSSKRKAAEHEAVPTRSQRTKKARSDAVVGVPKNKQAKISRYIGVTRARTKSLWEAQIVVGLLGQDKSTHGAKHKHLGTFATELAAAQAYDAEARKLRPKGQAHGVRIRSNWLRVNFPTAREEAYAARQGMPTAEGRLAATARAAAQGFKSKFVGLHWNPRSAKWNATVKHDCMNYYVGQFIDECQAARAFDELARKLRPAGKAHGMRGGTRWLRVNFPTDTEEAFAKASGMPTAISGAAA